jgi:predicted nucleotide-binding protein
LIAGIWNSRPFIEEILATNASKIRVEKVMPQERSKVPAQPPILPTVSSKEIIDLLVLQKDKGEELLKNRRLSLDDVQGWNVFTKEILTKAFGLKSAYIDSIIYAGEQRPHSAYEPEYILEKERRKNFEITLTMLESCIDQLNPESLKSAATPKGKSEESQEGPNNGVKPEVDEGKKDLALDLALDKEATKIELIPKAERMEKSSSRKVVIINGHNEEKKMEVANFIKSLGLEPLIPHDPSGQGINLIQDIEQHPDVVFAITLLTADDCGYPEGKPEEAKLRSKQEVIFELGFLIGRLEQNFVCALYEEGLDLPSEHHGEGFIPYDAGGLWKLLIARNMKMTNVDVDLNKAI